MSSNFPQDQLSSFASFTTSTLVDSVAPSESVSHQSSHSAEKQGLSAFHSLRAKDASGSDIYFSSYVGKPVLIVNVALESSLALQFSSLQTLYNIYHDKGLEILAFPCDQFGGACPESALEIHHYAARHYGVTYPIMEKVEVNGEKEHPVFHYLKSHKKNMLMETIKWNFEKFLVDGEGEVVERWSSVSSPDSVGPYVARILGLKQD